MSDDTFDPARRLTEAAIRVVEQMGGEVMEAGLITRSVNRGDLSRPQLQLLVRVPDPEREPEVDESLPTDDAIFAELTEGWDLVDGVIDVALEERATLDAAKGRVADVADRLGDVFDEYEEPHPRD